MKFDDAIKQFEDAMGAQEAATERADAALANLTFSFGPGEGRSITLRRSHEFGFAMTFGHQLGGESYSLDQFADFARWVLRGTGELMDVGDPETPIRREPATSEE